MMNFFEQQDTARRKSAVLLVLLVVVGMVLIVLVNGIVAISVSGGAGSLIYAQKQRHQTQALQQQFERYRRLWASRSHAAESRRTVERTVRNPTDDKLSSLVAQLRQAQQTQYLEERAATAKWLDSLVTLGVFPDLP